MNPLAFIILTGGTVCFIVGATSGTFNGASLLGLFLTLIALAVQSLRATTKDPS